MNRLFSEPKHYLQVPSFSRHMRQEQYTQEKRDVATEAEMVENAKV